MRILYGMNPVRELLRAGGEGLSELWLAEGGTRGQAFGELGLFEAELAHVRAWQALAIARGWRWEEAVTR